MTLRNAAYPPIWRVAAAASYSPGTETNIYNWVRADDISLSDGDGVSNWIDQTASALNWGQVTSGNRPLFKTNIFPSGLAGVKFDGTDDQLTNNVNGVNSFTLFFLVNFGTAKAANSKTAGLFDSAPLVEHTMRTLAVNNNVEIHDQAPAITIASNIASGGMVVSISGYQDDTTGRNLLIYTNGVQAGSNFNSTLFPIKWSGSFGGNTYLPTIGSINNGADVNFDGSIGEFYMLKPRATYLQLTNGAAYLKTRGGL